MEPATAFGIASGALQTIHVISSTIQELRKLYGKYTEAEGSIHSLINMMSTTKIALTKLHDWINCHEHDFLNTRPDFLQDLQIAVSGCDAIMEVFSVEVFRLVQSIRPHDQDEGRMGFRGRVRIVWNDQAMTEHCQRLWSQVSALQLLLQVCQCKTASEQLALLHRDENRILMSKAAADSATLRSTRSATSSCAVDSTGAASTRSERPTSDLDGNNGVNSDVDQSVMNLSMQTGSGPNPTSESGHPTFSTRLTRPDEGYSSGSAGAQSSGLLDPNTMQVPHQGEHFTATTAAHEPPAATNNGVSRWMSTALAQAGSAAIETARRPVSAGAANNASSPRRSFRVVVESFSLRRTASTGSSPLSADARPSRRGSNRQNGQGVSIDFSTGSGETAPPIVKAAQAGATLQVKVQIEGGANIEARHDKTARTALAVAAHCGQDDMVKLLVDKGANVKTKDVSAMSPLHLAASRGYTQTLKLLLEEDAEVDAKDKWGRTAFWIAAEAGYIDAASCLLDYNAKINSRAEGQLSALHRAARQGDRETVDFLRKHGIDVHAKDAKMKTALHHACEDGHTKVAERLLRFGAKTEATGLHQRTPLICAAAMGHLLTTKLLLKKKATVNATDDNGLNALHWAAFNGHIEVVRRLLEKNASITATTHLGCNALHLAAWGQQFPVVEELLQRQDVGLLQTRCREGLTPILYACKAGSDEVARLLLDANAGAHAPAEELQRWAIHLAALAGSVELCRLLSDKGLAIDIPDAYGKTPLGVACSEGHLDVSRFLLTAGASLGLHRPYSTGGMLPLCLAAMKGHGEIAKLLLDAGRWPSEPDDRGFYASTYAAHHGHPAILGSLLPHCDVRAKQHLCRFFSNYGFDKLGQVDEGHKKEVTVLVSQVIHELAQSGLLQLGPNGAPLPLPGSQTTIYHDHSRPGNAPPFTTAPAEQLGTSLELPAGSTLNSRAEFPSERSPDGTRRDHGHHDSADNQSRNPPTTTVEETQTQSQFYSSTVSPLSTQTKESSSDPTVAPGPSAPSYDPPEATFPGHFTSVGNFPSESPFQSSSGSREPPSRDVGSSPEDNPADLQEDSDRTPRLASAVPVAPRNSRSSGNEQAGEVSDTDSSAYVTAHEDSDDDRNGNGDSGP